MGKRKESKKKQAKEITEHVEADLVEKDEEKDDPAASIDGKMTVKMKKRKKHKEKLDLKIKIVDENPNKALPMVGYFTTPYDLSKNPPEIEGETQNKEKVKLYQGKKRTKRFELVVSPHDSRVDFVGTNYSGEATTAEMCNFCLGVLDKSTQTLKIVPIATNRVIRLEPRVQDPPDDETPVKELTAVEKPKIMEQLTSLYTTTRAQRKAQKSASLRQTDDAGNEQNPSGKFDIYSQVPENAPAANDARNIPPYDLGATTPQTAYPLDKIIFKGEWDYLDEILKLLEAGGTIGSGSFPTFVCNRVSRLKNINDEMERWKLGGILSYITHLIKYKDSHSAQYHTAKHHRLPKILTQKFNHMFAEADSKWLPDEKRDLLVNYVLVLTLHADDFRTDLSDIAKDLRMDIGALRNHYAFLGCKLVQEKKQSLATLPCPLKFPNMKRQHGKRRR